LKHFLLLYDLAPDYMERRSSLRGEHLQLAWAAHEQGQLVLGGALTEPTDTAVLLFKADSREAVESFAKADPYVTQGLVTAWRVREWTTVVGGDAAAPLRPPTRDAQD
jgi:uncharacterized protein YciI